MAGFISQGAQAAPTGAPGLYVQILPPPSFVAGVPTNIGAIAGSATWGPTNSPQLTGSPSDVFRSFGPVPNSSGSPAATTDATLNPFDLISASLLAYSQASASGGFSLWCLRSVDGPDVTVTDSSSAPSTGKFPAAYQIDHQIDATNNSLPTSTAASTTARFANLTLADVTKASLFIGSTTSPDGITWTAVPTGVAGNAITITQNAPSGATSTAAIVGNAITISPKSSETNSGLITAIASSVASLITGVATGGSDDVVAASVANLAGGGGGVSGASSPVLIGGGFLTALYYGTLGNGISVTITAGVSGTYTVTLTPPGGVGLNPETYPNLPASSAFWLALQNALANGIASIRGPSQLCRFIMPAQVMSGSGHVAGTNSTQAPSLLSTGVSLTAGADGTATLGTYTTVPSLAHTILGSNATTPVTGIYTLAGLNPPVAGFTIAGFGDNSYGDYTLLETGAITGGSGIADSMAAFFVSGLAQGDDTNTGQAVTDLGTLGIVDWEQIYVKDHVYFSDGVHPSRLMNPAAGAVGNICSLPPQNSPLNTTFKGTAGTYRTSSQGSPAPYSLAEIGQCQLNGIALITQPIPGANALGWATGVNASISYNPVTGPIEYTTLTNFLAKSLAGAFGKWVGKNQGPNDPDPTRQGVFSALSNFLQLQKNGNVITGFGVQCDKNNNPANSVAAHYLYASALVNYFASVWWFILSFTGGTTVNVSISQGSQT